MHKIIVEFFLVDILISIEKIKRFAKEYDTYEAFLADERGVSAIIRELTVIGEAIKNVLAHSSYEQLTHHDWRLIVDFRNVLVHYYFGTDYDEVFEIIKKDIIEFEKEYIDFIIALKERDSLSEVLATTKNELTRANRFETIKYLNKIELLFGK